jgi:hypothetical protein
MTDVPFEMTDSVSFEMTDRAPFEMSGMTFSFTKKRKRIAPCEEAPLDENDLIFLNEILNGPILLLQVSKIAS